MTCQFSTHVNCHLVDKINCKIPQSPVGLKIIQTHANVTLANTTFNQPSEINMLLGAYVYFQMLLLFKDFQEISVYVQLSSSPYIFNPKFDHVITGAVTANIIKYQVVFLIQAKCKYQEVLGGEARSGVTKRMVFRATICRKYFRKFS